MRENLLNPTKKSPIVKRNKKNVLEQNQNSERSLFFQKRLDVCFLTNRLVVLKTNLFKKTKINPKIKPNINPML
eukprot:m.259728 g.259728  ORF g.259728 m.259728 type:complete len:74 (+) comp38562_c0_seq1:1261-1482(+)